MRLDTPLVRRPRHLHDEHRACPNRRSVSRPAGEQIKAPGDRVSFQVEDADLSELVKAIGEPAGKRFVLATAKLKHARTTVYAPSKITVEEAYKRSCPCSQVNGLTVVPEGTRSRRAVS